MKKKTKKKTKKKKDKYFFNYDKNFIYLYHMNLQKIISYFICTHILKTYIHVYK